MRAIACLTSSRYSDAVNDQRPAALELDHHPGGAGLVDLRLAEADVGAVGVAVELAGELDRSLIQRLGLLAQPQRGDVVRVDAAEVRGEHLAVGLAQRGVQHPARLARQPLGGPLVAVGQVGDQRVQQRRRDVADGAQLLDAAEGDLAGADHLLRGLGELEQPHPGGHARLGPPERLRRAVLGQAAGEHRGDRPRLLIGVQLGADDVLRRALGMLALAAADLRADLGVARASASAA